MLTCKTVCLINISSLSYMVLCNVRSKTAILDRYAFVSRISSSCWHIAKFSVRLWWGSNSVHLDMFSSWIKLTLQSAGLLIIQSWSLVVGLSIQMPKCALWCGLWAKINSKTLKEVTGNLSTYFSKHTGFDSKSNMLTGANLGGWGCFDNMQMSNLGEKTKHAKFAKVN